MSALNVAEHITQWIQNYCKSYKINHLVVGVSGGIDSAVASTLCAKTKLDVSCIEMNIHQNKDQVTRASEHIQTLANQYENAQAYSLDLSATFDNFVQNMPQADDQSLTKMAQANSRARIRMTTLYYHAQINSGIVVGTGNKVEDFGVGFFTKYGDGGVDINPIADLYKTEVYALGKSLNINEQILNAAPTDGLWEDERTDEDQLGASYEELEWAMENEGKQENLTERQKEVMAIYEKHHKTNIHKMKPIPVCTIPNKFKPLQH